MSLHNALAFVVPMVEMILEAGGVTLIVVSA